MYVFCWRWNSWVIVTSLPLVLTMKTTQNLWRHQYLWTRPVMTSRPSLHCLRVLTKWLRSATRAGQGPTQERSWWNRRRRTSAVRSDIRGSECRSWYFHARSYLAICHRQYLVICTLPSAGTWPDRSAVDMRTVRLLIVTRKLQCGNGWPSTMASLCSCISLILH